jgi:hypothetical protein
VSSAVKNPAPLILSSKRLAGASQLTWSSSPNKTYSVLRSSDVRFQTFDVIASGVPGNAATFTDTTLPLGATPMFYKVRVDQ